MDDLANQFYEGLHEGINDPFYRNASNSDEDDDSFLVGFIVHAILGSFFVWAIKKCCCRGAAGNGVTDEVLIAKSEHLQPRKRLLTGYCLLFSGGLFGVHHFYLDRLVHGLLACWSLNFLGVGVLLDFFLLPYYTRRFNRRRADDDAPNDDSQWVLRFKLPGSVFLIFFALCCFFLCGPFLLHKTGVVDIERLAAQTEQNPYDILGIPHSADLAEAKKAYKKVSLKWHPDRNPGCGTECDDKMSDIGKAFDAIKKRRAGVFSSSDNTWASWLKDHGQDWMYVFEILGKKDEPAAKKPTKGSKSEL